MTILLAPIADRAKIRRLVAAIDVLLGWPRQHTEDDVIRHGRGPHAPIESIRTETQTSIYVHIGRGMLAVQIDDVVMRLLDREADVQDGSVRRIRVRVDDPGWQVVETLPWPEENWTQAPFRDGLAGSTTGERV